MKRIFLFILVAILSVSMVVTISLIGCKEEALQTVEEVVEEEVEVEEVAEEEVEEITINIWDWQGVAGEYWDSISSEYKKINPNVTIVRKAFNLGDFNTALKAALAADDPPDMFEIHPGTQSIELVDAEQLIDLTDYLSEDAEWSDWIAPSLKLKDSYVNERIYGIPLTVNNLAVCYWKSLLDEKGLVFPKTIDELKEVAAAFEGEGIDILGLGLKDVWPSNEIFIALVRSADKSGDLIDRANNGEASWEDPLFKEAFEAIASFKDSGIVSENMLERSFQEDAIGMGKQEILMMYPLPTGAQFLLELDKSEYSNLGLAPFPALNAGGTPMLTGGAGVVIGASPLIDEDKKAVVLDILKFISGAAVQEIIFDIGQTPAGNLVDKETDDLLFSAFTYNQNNSTIGYRYIENADISSAVQNGIQSILIGEDIDTVLKGIEQISQEVNSK